MYGIKKNGGMTHTDTQYIPPKGKARGLNPASLFPSAFV